MTIVRFVKLLEVTHDPLFQGKEKGEAHVPLFAKHLNPAGTIVLDFSDVLSLTSSYFFKAIWPFWTREDADGPSTFPLIANAADIVAEELDFCMNYRRMAAWRGRWDGGAFTPDDLFGVKDDSLPVVVRQIRATGSAITAVDLASVDKTNANAWSNRLAALHKQRLLQRRQSGRKQLYFLPWEDDNRDG
jgi:hypothetical protein